MSLEQQIRRAKEDKSGNIWALLVAGSKDWKNYRHQSDICHAYQIYRANGIPDSNIVVMMYDDIAYHAMNPDKGKIINNPVGINVYTNVPKDYTGVNVNEEVFRKVLLGNPPGVGSNKVIGSGPNDYVFLNYAAHGGYNYIDFPTGPVLTKVELQFTLTAMHSAKRYKQLMLYFESCESGSMFYNSLPNDTKAYATTACLIGEKSYAYYWDGRLQTYLGDHYDISWMESIDNTGTEQTLDQHYRTTKALTTRSTVEQYGDTSFVSDKLKVFFGTPTTTSEMTKPKESAQEPVPCDDVPIAILMHKIFECPNEFAKRDHELALMEELVKREKVRKTFKRIVRAVVGEEKKASILNGTARLTKSDRFKAAVDRFSEKCFNISEVDYALSFLHILMNLCEHEGTTMEEILDAIDQAGAALRC